VQYLAPLPLMRLLINDTDGIIAKAKKGTI